MNIVLFEGEPFFPKGDERFQHIRKILKLGVGDVFFAGLVDGDQGSATITRMDDSGVAFDFRAERPMRALNPVHVIIGFPRPIQLKRLLRDVASLGAAAVHLTGTELGEKSYLESSLAEYDAVRACLVDGVVQSGATAVPSLALHPSVRDTIEALAAVPYAARILLDVENPSCSLARFPFPTVSAPSPLLLAIGSERGWTSGERALFRESGFVVCSLGGRILRTETAATAALSIALANIDCMEGLA
jgi:RsmE family RNA methyltransferase